MDEPALRHGITIADRVTFAFDALQKAYAAVLAVDQDPAREQWAQPVDR